MKTKYREKIAPYLQDLSSRGPVGGGSAAALTGTMAAALALKALGYSAGKTAGRQKARLEAARRHFIRIHKILAAYVDKDAAFFAEYLREKNSRKKERLLKKSSQGVAEMLQCCIDGVGSLGTCYAYVRKSLFSDIMISFLLFETAGDACAINLEINDKMLKKSFAGLWQTRWKRAKRSRQETLHILRKEFDRG